MKFTVVALESINETLARLYLEAKDQKALTEAADWIENQLKSDPLNKVTPIDDLYFLRRDPLVALCSISVEDRLVNILEVHRTDE
jgi:hypothetical protein